MPKGTPFHERTFPLCHTLSYRDWSGYYAVSAYEVNFEHEYHAIRHAAALIDVSPLYKYRISGPDAAVLLDQIVTRDIRRMSRGQVIYTPWCDDDGKVIDDGTVSRLDEDVYRLTAAESTLRWLHRNADRLRVEIVDASESLAALAVQGPMAGAVLQAVADANIVGLKYFRVTAGRIAGVPVDISRTGYTGDLGYEVWVPASAAITVWDALQNGGRPFGLRPAGLLALDVARVEAGLLLLDVDFVGSRKALTEDQRYTPYEMNLGRLVDLGKARFVGRAALARDHARGPRRRIVGLELVWDDVERAFDRHGLAPVVPAATSRAAVPVFARGRQAGKVTSTSWSPVMKKLVALATIDAPSDVPGSTVQVELTVEAVRHTVSARVVKTPFFNPARKTALPASVV